MTPVVLPPFLRPASGVPLIRLGSDHDGGYLIDRRNLDHADLLLSFGINDDWRFEEAFVAACDVPLAAYDATVSAWDFFIAFYTRVALFEPINARRAYRLYRDFKRFFRGRRRVHHPHHVGIGPAPRFVPPEEVFALPPVAGARSIFLKVDIEGSEYGILDTLIAHADRIEGLTVEFHDIDRDMARLRRFVEAFPLTLCHIHANNMGRVLDDGLPVVVECSFTRQSVGGGTPADLPHALDTPNLPRFPELQIRFAGD